MAITDTATHKASGEYLGTVWIDEHLAIGSEMPGGGVKGSGSART